MKQPSLLGNAFVKLYETVKRSGRPLTKVSAQPPTLNIASSAQIDPDILLEPHNLLASATHPDTTTGTVVRGDIIAGIGATPKWTRVAKGNSGDVLTMGASEPGWVASTNYWQRSGTTLSPVTAGDDVQTDTVIGGTGAGDDLTLSSTSHATKGYVQITDGSILAVGQVLAGTSGTSDGDTGLYSTAGGATGATRGIVGQTDSTSTSAKGVEGYASGATGATRGIYGSTASSNNAAYSLYANERTYLGNWADLDEQGSNPASPESTNARTFAKAGPLAGSRLYMKDDTGVVHDMMVQCKQTYPCAAGLEGQSSSAPVYPCAYGYAALTGYAPPAGLVFVTNQVFGLPSASGEYVLTDSYWQAIWTSVGEPTNEQASVYIGNVSRWHPGDAGTTKCKAVRVSTRMFLADVSKFGAVILTLSDVDGTNRDLTTCSFSSPGDDATWKEFVSGVIDVSSWTGPLRVTLTANGSDSEFGDCAVAVEYLAIEFWAG